MSCTFATTLKSKSRQSVQLQSNREFGIVYQTLYICFWTSMRSVSRNIGSFFRRFCWIFSSKKPIRILFFIVDPVQPRNKKRDITCLVLRNSPWIFKSTSLHGPVSFVSVQLFPNDQSKSSLELCFRHQSVMRQATVKQVTYAIKVNTHWRWGETRCADTIFLVGHAGFFCKNCGPPRMSHKMQLVWIQWSQFSMSHPAHCSCELTALQPLPVHQLACLALQHASYVLTWRGL